MNYKNWDNRKPNRGRGRGSWNWRGRGHRMPMSNSFVPNHGWANNLPNYNQYRPPHQEQNSYYYNPRHTKPFNAPINIISNILTKPASPLPGSEEYTQNKIQQTSDLIKRQLNIDSETCSISESNVSSDATFNEYTNNNSETNLQGNNASFDSPNLSAENKKTSKQLTRRNKTPEIIDVQEIHNKIIKHISSLSYNKKMNLVNQSTSGYDIAIQEVQRQKRLELSRALRDMSKRQTQNSDDGEVINAIIPDIGIKIEDLPNDIIAELSNSLNLHLDDQVMNLVDPEECFKQAEEILNVNFEGDDRNLKAFQHNLMMVGDISDQLGNRVLNSISGGDITSLHPPLSDKPEPQYQLLCDTNFEDNTSIYDSFAPSQIGPSDIHLNKNIENDDNNKSDDDYSKDLEFSNFCFENFDLNKSYLVPPISTKSPPQTYISGSNVSIDMPKISVRKDILQDTNIISNITPSPKKTSLSTNIATSVNLPSDNTKSTTKDGNNIFDPIIEKSCAEEKSQEHISQNKTSLDSSEFSKYIKSAFLPNDVLTSISEGDCTDGTKDLCSPSDMFNTEIESISSGQQYLVPTDIPLPVENQESQISQIPQSLEYCTQKRWKSPGEKKMMADIQPKMKVIDTSKLTLEMPVIQCKLENTTDYVSPSNAIEDHFDLIPIEPNVNTPLKDQEIVTNKNLIIEQIDTPIDKEDVPNPEKQLVTDEVNNKTKESTDFTGALPPVLDQKQLEAESKPTNKSLKLKDNIPEKHQNTKHKKTKSTEPRNSPKPTNSKNILRDTSVTTEVVAASSSKTTSSDQSILPDTSAKNKDESSEASKTSNLKEHRKVKTAAEKKETAPISKNSSNACTQTNLEKDENIIISKITKSVYIQTMVDDKVKSEIKFVDKGVGTLKATKHIHTQTVVDKPQIETPKATGQKETQTVKNTKSVHIQTSSENQKNDTEKKAKEYKNVEIQVSSSVTSTSAQTKTNSENYDAELLSTNYLNYFLKLKEIDLEIEKLIETKKNLYKTIECKHSVPTITPSPQQTLNATEVNQEEKSLKDEKIPNTISKKHKKTDSDVELDESLHNPKRKKRHRNSRRGQVSTPKKPNFADDGALKKTEDIKLDDENREDKRKPLSIKISLKNLMHSPKLDPENVTKKPLNDVTTKVTSRRNSTEESHHSSVDEVKKDRYSEIISRKRHSVERKPVVENSNHEKKNAMNKSSNNQSEIKNSNLDNPPEKRQVKRSKNRRTKTNKQDLSLCSVKLSSENPQEKLAIKKCHVLIERHTVEYLQFLKRKLHERGKSQSNTPIDLPNESTSDVEMDTSKICDKTDLEFTNFLGAVLDVKIIQEILIVATESGQLYFFNVNTGDEISSLRISEKPLTSMCTSINDQSSNIYVGCLMGVLTVLNFSSKTVTNTVQCEDGVQCLEKEWEYVFMGSQRGHVMRYNFKKNKLEQSLKIYDSNIFAIKATQEGARRIILVASRNAQVTVRDAMSGLLMRTMESTFYPTVYTILFQNNFVYCGTSQHDILVYTFQDGQLNFKYEAANSKGIVCLKTAGDLLFAGCYNGNIYIYGINSKQFLGQIAGPGGMLLSMEVYGNKLVVGTKTNKLKSITIPQEFLDQSTS